MKRWLIVLLFCAASLTAPPKSHAQAWSSILATSRAINWTVAGLPTCIAYGTSSCFSGTPPACNGSLANCVETISNPYTPPTRVQCGAPISGGTSGSPSSVTAINTALTSCKPGSYILLGSGYFLTNGTSITMWQTQGITLRGSGANSTFITVSSADYIAIGGANGGSSGTMSATSYSAGTTSITITGATATPAVGNLAWVNQCDTGSGSSTCTTNPADNGSLFICGDYTGCDTGGTESTSFAHQFQSVIITSVTNNGGNSYTLGISPGLYMPNWTSNSGATLSWQTQSWDAFGNAIEDMEIIAAAGTNSNNYLVLLNYGYGSWVKGVAFVGSGANSSFGQITVLNDLIMNSYFAPSATLPNNYSYGLFGTNLTDELVLNNIFSNGLPIELQGGNVGNVFAYNIARDGFTLYPFNVLAFDHHAFSSFDLWEGNQNAVFQEDNTWGSHALNTYFRNNMQCNDFPYVGDYTQGNNYDSLQLNNYQRFENIVGNAMGTNTTLCGTYQSSGFSSIFHILTGDSLVASTLMRWGNVSIVQQSSDTPTNSGIRFVSAEVPSSLGSPNTAWQNSVPSNDNLPCSFFLSGSSFTSSPCSVLHSGGTGLSWWKVCKTWATFPTSCSATQTQAFPTSGPDESSGNYVSGYAYDNAAAIAWLNLPVDTTYQNSYTITASSWTSGTETLTVSGLPTGCNGGGTTGCHVIGPFQLSGVGGSCATGATINAANEILMTGSTPTTITYALASNPGSNACTGTFKFPDKRQFDERVYQLDSGSVVPPPAPFPTILAGQIKQSGGVTR